MNTKNKSYTSDEPSKMNYLLANNPTGELIHYLSRVFKVYKKKLKKF